MGQLPKFNTENEDLNVKIKHTPIPQSRSVCSSLTFPKIYEFGGPPVVPRSLGARLSSCIEDLKAFVIAKFICQFLLSATKPTTGR